MMCRNTLLAVLTIAACCMRQDASGVALAAETQPGNWVVTLNENVPVMAGRSRLFVLSKGTELLAGETRDDWLAVTVMEGEKQIPGWVKQGSVAPVGYRSELHRAFSTELAAVPAEKRYIAFSLKVARDRIEPSSAGESSVVGAVARALFSTGGSQGAARNRENVGSEVLYLGGMTCLRGVVVDAQSEDLIVVGQYIPGRQRLTLDDLVVALRSRFVHRQWPVVSIDPPAERREPVYHNVRFEGGVRDTAFGLTLFEADYLLKKVGQGHVPTGVPEVPSEWSLWVEQARREYGQKEVNISGRVWFFPELGATPVRQNVAAYSGLKVGVYYEVLSAKIEGRRVRDLTTIKSDTGEQFVALIRRHYDELAAMHPSWRRIKQLNELVALSRAVEVMDPRPDLSWWLESYPLTQVETPRRARELTRSRTFNEGYYTHVVSQQGGVELRAMALRLEAGDVSALADAALSTRPAHDALTWCFVVDDWVIPIPPELDVSHGGELTPQFVYAQFLTRQGKYELALKRLDRILAIEPNYLDALLWKGTLLSDNLGQQQEAIKCFNVALKKAPDSVDALVGRGWARAKADDFFEATKDFDKALQINPKLANALAYRGLCHEQFGEYDKAIGDLTEAARLAPAEAIIYVWRGNIFRVQGETEKALADFTEAIGRNSSLAWAYACRGELHRAQSELNKALADLNEAIRLDPTSDLSYYAARAEVYAELGKHAEEVADYSTILDREPNNTEARWRRSEAYRKARQFQKALEDCTKLDLLLFVEVTPESAPLKAGKKNVGTVYQGEEVKVMQSKGGWLWVEAVLSSGKVLQGWIDQKHVR